MNDIEAKEVGYKMALNDVMDYLNKLIDYSIKSEQECHTKQNITRQYNCIDAYSNVFKHCKKLFDECDVGNAEEHSTEEPLKMNVVIHNGGHMPAKAHPTDAGYDLRTPEAFTLFAGCSRMVDVLVSAEIPYGYYGAIKPRSSLYSRGIFTNGTIDCGYTGHIKVMLWNLGDNMASFKAGDKIAQMVIVPCANFQLERVSNLEQTERGAGGFGSTGR